MSLQETIEELKAQIKEEEGQEEEVVEEEQEEPEAEANEEEPKEEEKEEEKEEKKKEEELDAAGHARLRREARAAEKRAEQAERERNEAREELDRLKESKQQEQEEVEAPALPPEFTEIIQTHRLSKAETEFNSLEAKFKANVPDYGAVAQEYSMALAQSIRIQNPRMPLDKVADKVKHTILLQAGEYQRNGYDPIEELYHSAKELGFTGASLQKQPVEAEEKEVDIKPDMKRVAENRKRSSGMAATGSGDSRGSMTKQYAADNLTLAEWGNLSASERRKLMYG